MFTKFLLVALLMASGSFALADDSVVRLSGPLGAQHVNPRLNNAKEVSRSDFKDLILASLWLTVEIDPTYRPEKSEFVKSLPVSKADAQIVFATLADHIGVRGLFGNEFSPARMALQSALTEWSISESEDPRSRAADIFEPFMTKSSEGNRINEVLGRLANNMVPLILLFTLTSLVKQAEEKDSYWLESLQTLKTATDEELSYLDEHIEAAGESYPHEIEEFKVGVKNALQALDPSKRGQALFAELSVVFKARRLFCDATLENLMDPGED